MAKKRKVTDDLKDLEKQDIIRSKSVAQKMKRRTVSKWVALILVIALLITGSAWGILTIVDFNSMKITINKDAQGSIALSPDDTFDYPTSNITVKGPDRMDAVTYPQLDIDKDILSVVGTESSPANYIAYSVYLKNYSSTRDIEYATLLTIPKTHKNFDAAIRVMVIKEIAGVQTLNIYAKPKDDGSAEAVAYDMDDGNNQRPLSVEELNVNKPGFLTSNLTTPFMGKIKENPSDENYYIALELDQPLKIGESVKYTVALWVEGTDHECKDDILGGFCTVRLEFGISSSEIDENQSLPNA